MKYESAKTNKGNVGVSWSSQELADAQSKEMDDGGNVNCYGCSRCSRCSDCSDCSDCSRCSDCSDCSDCSRCSGCWGCSGCSDCSRCSGCWGCSRCSDCWGCSRCSDCWGCSRCWGCWDCWNLKNAAPVQQDEVSTLNRDLGAPAIPVIENIHQTVLDAVSQPNALDMSDWHVCETTHCRAGWVVTLAGEAGKKLEAFHNTPLAAQLIYHASSPDLPVSPPRFYENNEVAMADMKRLAELEAKVNG